ncbi:MAG: penicillin-binding protein 2 [Candidatus Krumholzibacteriota bacterium]|nr:penicillin-binding protein 2 [Candidatus Krumholzibacteriota bacterium]
MGRCRPRHEIPLLAALVVATAAVLGLRLFQIQVLRHDRYRELAGRQWEKKIRLPALRGNLYDRRGTPLAVSTLATHVSCDPQCLRALPDSERQDLLAAIAPVLGRTPRALERALARASGRYLVLHEGLVLAMPERRLLERSGLLHLERQAQRLYPLGATGAPLVGFVNAGGQGVAGLEAGLQEALAGRPGLALVPKDGRGRSLLGSGQRLLVPPRQGDDVLLTIDHKVQALADAELARAAEAAGARAGSAVVLDPATGDILALSTWPSPERRGAYRPAEWQLLPVHAAYEPGSTFKALSAIPLLERGGLDLATTADPEGGRACIEGIWIRDDRPHHGLLSFREAFVHSSNICFAKFAVRITDQELFRAYQDLGLGIPCGLILPGEEGGVLRKPCEWSGRSRMTLVFGQELSATPLQVTAAFGALANEGRLMRPRLVRARRDRAGGELTTVEPVALRRVCRASTARCILDLMGEAVARGTGERAAVAGLRVGGKTGTAQKFEDGRLKQGAYLASFVGVAPLARPRLVVGVFLDEPDTEHYHGGQSAAPAFARIVEGIAVATDYLLDAAAAPPPDPAAAAARAPRLLDLPVNRADSLALARHLSVRFQGEGARVVAQLPGPGCPLLPDQPLLLILGDPERRLDPPDLRGLSLREARRRALEGGYDVLPRGRGVVTGQAAPDPARGGLIVLDLATVASEQRS